MNPKNKILLATNNSGKVVELRELLRDMDLEILTPSQINLALDVEEDGINYRENAAKKARAFARAGGMLALADDSGLEVDVLSGAPGLYSARYSPKPNANDKDRRDYLLSALASKPRPWMARFRATIAVASPTGEVEYAEGECLGEIIGEERGTRGFGYDPIFLFPELGKTMSELTLEEKNQMSHRARAILAAKPILRRAFSG